MNDLAGAAERLSARLARCCASDAVKEDCGRWLALLKSATESGDADAASRAVDFFVLAVQRHLGSELSLRDAFDLVQPAFAEVKAVVADPGDVFIEAQSFWERFQDVLLATRAPFSYWAPPRVEGVEETHAALRERIQSYALPSEAEERLLETLDEMVAIERRGLERPDADAQFVEALEAFQATVEPLVGRYVTTSERNHLYGVIGFGRPASICFTLITILAQVGLVVLVVGGVYLIFRAPAAKRATNGVLDYVGEGKHKKSDLLKKLDELTKDLSADEKKEVREQLTKALDSPVLDKDAKAQIRDAIASLKD